MQAQPAARPARRLEWVTGLLALAYLGSRLPGSFAALDNLSNFPFHFAVAFLACAMALALRGRRLAALAAAAAALLPIAQVAPWYFGREPAPSGAAPPVKLLVANVYYGNREYGRIQRLIAREDPDVVGLVEVDLDWLRKHAKARLDELLATQPEAQLSDAQFALAKEYGFSSWRALKAHVDAKTLEGQLLKAIADDDLAAFTAMIDAHAGISVGPDLSRNLSRSASFRMWCT